MGMASPAGRAPRRRLRQGGVPGPGGGGAHDTRHASVVAGSLQTNRLCRLTNLQMLASRVSRPRVEPRGGGGARQPPGRACATRGRTPPTRYLSVSRQFCRSRWTILGWCDHVRCSPQSRTLCGEAVAVAPTARLAGRVRCALGCPRRLASAADACAAPLGPAGALVTCPLSPAPPWPRRLS